MFTKATILASLALVAGTAAACPSGGLFVKDHEAAGRTVCRFTTNQLLGAELRLETSDDDPKFKEKMDAYEAAMTTVTLDNKYDYILVRNESENSFGTYVGGDNQRPVKLVIERGVKIYGQANTFLSISRGSRIYANGTESRPIVFDSAEPEDKQIGGLWGGLVLNGNAVVNKLATEGLCAGSSKFEGVNEREVCFGGQLTKDSSGSLKYVRVQRGGYPIVPDKEINGYSFNGVGSSTKVDYLQAHLINDDCFEFFGGSVNARHLVCTAGDDDGIDADLGYNGKIQFALIKYAAYRKGDSAFEWNNNDDDNSVLPRTIPMIANLTAIGNAVSTVDPEKITTGYGMSLRQGTGGLIMNSIFTEFTKGCMDVDNASTWSHGELTVIGSTVYCNKNFEQEAEETFDLASWFNSLPGNRTANPELNGIALPDDSPLATAAVYPDKLDRFFEDVDFVGAIENTREDWTAGWTKQ